MTRISALVMLALASPLLAAEKDAAKPVGTWTREVSGHTVAFTFNADATFKMAVDAGGKRADVTGSYGLTKDGVVFAIMTKVATDLGDGPEKGDLFAFAFRVSEKELTVSDLKGTKVNDGARKLVEGVYTKK